MGYLMVFVSFAMRWLAHVYHSLTVNLLAVARALCSLRRSCESRIARDALANQARDQ